MIDRTFSLYGNHRIPLVILLERWQDPALQLRDSNEDPVDYRLDLALELRLLGLVQKGHVGVTRRLQPGLFKQIRLFAVQHLVGTP